MEKQISREEILHRLKSVEHPEIAVSLIDLGMILDVAIEQNTVKIAIALPMINIPQAVTDAIVQSIYHPIRELGLEIKPEYFEMTPDVRDQFFTAARANWKGSI